MRIDRRNDVESTSSRPIISHWVASGLWSAHLSSQVIRRLGLPTKFFRLARLPCCVLAINDTVPSPLAPGLLCAGLPLTLTLFLLFLATDPYAAEEHVPMLDLSQVNHKLRGRL